MPPRRGGRGRGRGTPQKRNQSPRNNLFELKENENENESTGDDQVSELMCDAVNEIQNGTPLAETETNSEIKDESVCETQNETIDGDDTAEPENNVTVEEAKETENNSSSSDLPYKVNISNLPATYAVSEFERYIRFTFNMEVPKITCPNKNSPWLLLSFASKEEQENCVKSLHNHVWKKKVLRGVAFYGTTPHKHVLEERDDSEVKRLKLEESSKQSIEEEILSESFPLLNVPYEEQNRLSVQDVKLLSNKLHALMCIRNPNLAGWAEAMIEKYNGVIFNIEPLKPSSLLKGYRNRCKFRIGKNTEGETTVGFCLNDNENKILGVQPGDKLIHIPDSMKYAAKKFEDFIRASGKKPYDKKQKCGFWDHIIIRIAPEDSLMFVVVMYHNQLSDEAIAEIKNEVKEYFINGEGKDIKLHSLFFQIMNDKTPMMSSDRLELLHGESHFFENICGINFYVGPFSILNVNSSSSENIYKSIAELAEPTPETTVLDLCCGTGGIAFTLSDKCKNVIAIDSQEDHIKYALKTKEANNIQNVEFIKGKVEDVLEEVFGKIGEAPIIPVIDPPRQGLVQKAISMIRANENIKKLVYVCSNSKMGAKNFLDLCASSEKKEGTFGNPLNVVFAGLPFLPVRVIPLDIAPYTVNNTIIILFERIDPSTFPPAKNPPPQPLKRQQTKKEEKKRKRNQGRRMRGMSGGRGKRFRPSGSGIRGGIKTPSFKKRSQQQRGFNMNQNRFPQPLLRSLDPALSLVAKYERRIAELEQQDRAFKAGLSMGLQALGTRGGPGGPGGPAFEPFGNNFNSGLGNNFGNFRNQIIGDNPAWQRGGGRNFDNIGMNFGGNNFGNGGFGIGAGFNSFNEGSGFGNFRGGPTLGNSNSSFRGGAGKGNTRHRNRRRR